MKSPVAPSPRPLRDVRLALALWSAALVASCGLSDVFATPGAGDVIFVWEGSTDMNTGQVAPILITVFADGEPLIEPRLLVTVPDTTAAAAIAFDASGDSIVALRPGHDMVVVELLTSLATGILRDSFEIRVTGGPPP